MLEICQFDHLPHELSIKISSYLKIKSFLNFLQTNKKINKYIESQINLNYFQYSSAHFFTYELTDYRSVVIGEALLIKAINKKDASAIKNLFNLGVILTRFVVERVDSLAPDYNSEVLMLFKNQQELWYLSSHLYGFSYVELEDKFKQLFKEHYYLKCRNYKSQSALEIIAQYSYFSYTFGLCEITSLNDQLFDNNCDSLEPRTKKELYSHLPITDVLVEKIINKTNKISNDIKNGKKKDLISNDAITRLAERNLFIKACRPDLDEAKLKDLYNYGIDFYDGDFDENVQIPVFFNDLINDCEVFFMSEINYATVADAIKRGVNLNNIHFTYLHQFNENQQIINDSYIYETNPLLYAIMQGEIEIAKLLITAGININFSDSIGLTALHHAAMISSCELVKILIDKGANVNATNNDDNTPLNIHLISPNFTIEIFNLLKDAGATYNLKTKELQESFIIGLTNNFDNSDFKKALEYAYTSISLNKKSELISLHIFNIYRNFISKKTITDKEKELLLFLLEQDFFICRKYPHLLHSILNSELHIFVTPRLLDKLIATMIEPNIAFIDNGYSLCHIASIWKRPDLIKIMHIYGINLTYLDAANNLAIGYAVINKDLETYEILINYVKNDSSLNSIFKHRLTLHCYYLAMINQSYNIMDFIIANNDSFWINSNLINSFMRTFIVLSICTLNKVINKINFNNESRLNYFVASEILVNVLSNKYVGHNSFNCSLFLPIGVDTICLIAPSIINQEFKINIVDIAIFSCKTIYNVLSYKSQLESYQIKERQPKQLEVN